MAEYYLNDPPDFAYRRERKIDAAPKQPTPASAQPESASKEESLKVFSDAAKLISKAERLLAAATQMAKQFIPVHEQALEVRQAIRSLYPGAQEDQITFQQFMDSLSYVENIGNVDPIILHDSMTGDPQVDSRIINQTVVRSTDGLSSRQLATMAGQFAVLMICSRMLQVFQGPNIQAATAGKAPFGTEVAPVLAQILMGILAILLQSAMTEEDVKSAMVEVYGDVIAGSGLSPDDLIARAKSQEPDPVLTNYNRTRRGEYYDSIRGYSYEYSTNHTHEGYDSWVVASEARGIKSDLSATVKEAGMYVSGPYTLGREVYDVLTTKNVSLNSAMNALGAIISSRYTRDMICCLVRFIGALPTDLLKQIRLMLQLLVNGLSIDLGSVFSAATQSATAYLEQAVLEPMLHQVDAFFNNQKQTLSALINPSSYGNGSDTMETILLCTPIDEMFTYLLSGLEKIQQLVVKYIRKIWLRVHDREFRFKVGPKIMADCKKIGFLLQIVDQVMASVESGNLCAREDERTPALEDSEEVTNTIFHNMPSPIVLDMAGDPYETFSSSDLATIKTSLGLDAIASRSSGDSDTAGVPDCVRARIGEESLAGVLERIKALDRDLADVDME